MLVVVDIFLKLCQVELLRYGTLLSQNLPILNSPDIFLQEYGNATSVAENPIQLRKVHPNIDLILCHHCIGLIRQNINEIKCQFSNIPDPLVVNWLLTIMGN